MLLRGGDGHAAAGPSPAGDGPAARDRRAGIRASLREHGVRIAMDDFGTGYSSLSYLRRFPLDKIKIDKSIVHGIAGGAEAVAIVHAVAGLGISLGVQTTAEGVETPEQLAQVTSEGCTEVQGYLFSPPRPGAETGALIARLNAAAPLAQAPAG
ncbi:EAL domain-containing protein [Roseomonas sp. GCM10028921]